MAYISQELKTKKLEQIKAILPKGWKVSASVKHHMDLQITLTTPFVPAQYATCLKRMLSGHRHWIYPVKDEITFHGAHHLLNDWKNLLSGYPDNAPNIINQIASIMDEGNHHNSDAMTDYFDEGWYQTIVLKPSKSALEKLDDTIYAFTHYITRNKDGEFVPTFRTMTEEEYLNHNWKKEYPVFQ